MPVDVKGRQVEARFVSGTTFGFTGYGPAPPHEDGTPAYPVLVLGKYPGADEARYGINFIGPSSATLFRALDELGMASIRRVEEGDGSDRPFRLALDDLDKGGEVRDWYFTNVCKHPSLDPSTTAVAARWLKNALPLLEQELRIVRPRFILCFGTEACKALLGPKATVSRLYGRVETLRIPLHRKGAPPEAQQWHEAQVMACVHPAYVARKPEAYADSYFLNGMGPGVCPGIIARIVLCIVKPETRGSQDAIRAPVVHAIEPQPGGRPEAVGAGMTSAGFTADTELLTDAGWIPAGALHEQLRGGHRRRVAQYVPETDAVEFVAPDVAEVRYKGPLLRIWTKRKIDLLLPPGHPCLLRSRNTDRFEVVPAADYPNGWHQLHAGYYAGGSVHLDPARVAWLCAVQADGSVRQGNAISFGFSRQRKIDRLVPAMRQLGVRYAEHAPNAPVGEKARFWIGPAENRAFLDWTFGLLGREKTFGAWLLDLDRATLDLFAEEVLNWDGTVETRDRYGSVERVNADWVQIAWTLSGGRARVQPYRNKVPNARDCHTVHLSPGERAHSLTYNLTRAEVAWDGPLYGVGVPSGFVVLRRDGKASITGGGWSKPRPRGSRRSVEAAGTRR